MYTICYREEEEVGGGVRGAKTKREMKEQQLKPNEQMITRLNDSMCVNDGNFFLASSSHALETLMAVLKVTLFMSDALWPHRHFVFCALLPHAPS